MPVSVSPKSLRQLEAAADSAYQAKGYVFAAERYEMLGQRARFATGRGNAHYNSACCRALVGQTDLALRELEAAVKAGYRDASQIQSDTDLASLRATPRYQQLLRRLAAHPETVPTDPEKALLVTADIDRFWRAYDHAQRQPDRAVAIYDQEYFDKGSVGLQDYYELKIKDTKLFVQNQEAKKDFYRSIRPNTQRVAAMTAQIRAGFRKMKELYPAAEFPPVYFVIGRFNSGGTASQHGMLIGTDQMSGAPDTPRGELSLWERNTLGPIETLPDIVAHEQVHYLQKKGGPSTLLRGAINEGMADFLAELTTGCRPTSRYYTYGDAHEKQVWADFTKEMDGTNWNNWIANGGTQETEEKPGDLGYYVGYRICQAYYEEQTDKKQAVHDILNISDYPAFLAASRYEAKLATR
ncbi:hypothetical protein GCM10022409_12990 [Hymenobacter glaciei]|uniref:DUF2268 domain-containing protein n=1 Tax=Hymenobacter glaciei TaxID=877209 RepID=A0ABP7TS15_9BACT